jgi:hypothetical protein
VILWEFVTLHIIVDEKHVKNDAMDFNLFTVVISVFRKNVAKLHLHSLYPSGEINNNVLKLFYSICKLFTVEVRQRWKRLQGSSAETIVRLWQFFFFSLHFPVD